MKGKGIKPHVQPVRPEVPEPVKRPGAWPAKKKMTSTDSGKSIIRENVPAKDGPEAGMAGEKAKTGRE